MNNELEKEEKREKRKVEISEEGYQHLSGFLSKININGRTKIRTPDILEYAVSKLRESDIETIQEKYYSPADKIDLLLERINRERSDNPMTKEQLLASMLDNFKPGQAKNGGAHKEIPK